MNGNLQNTGISEIASPLDQVLLTVVVPVYGEVRFLAELLERIDEVPIRKEIVVVHDASNVQTNKALAGFSGRPNFEMVVHNSIKGKGDALAVGFKRASGKIVLVQDANLEYEPAEYHHLIAPILEDKADVVYGSRFAGGDSRRVLYFWHSMGNMILTLVSNMLTNLNLTDVETGFKVFRREVLDSLNLRSRRFGVDPEITMKIARARYRIFEVPISYSGRTDEPGRCTGWTDALEAIWVMFIHRFVYPAPRPPQTPTEPDRASQIDADGGDSMGVGV